MRWAGCYHSINVVFFDEFNRFFQRVFVPPFARIGKQKVAPQKFRGFLKKAFFRFVGKAAVGNFLFP